MSNRSDGDGQVLLELEEDEVNIGINAMWAVSPALRRLLESTENLRHAECCLINRKVHTVRDLRDMGAKDQESFIKEVEHIWTELRWNTARLPGAIAALIDEAKKTSSASSQGRLTQDTVCAGQTLGLSEARFGQQALSPNPFDFHGRGVCVDTVAMFPVFISQAAAMASSAAAFGIIDVASSVYQGNHPTDVMQALTKDLDAARGLLGANRFQEVCRYLQLSEARAADSAAAIAKAWALADEVPLPPEDVTIPEAQRPRKLLKNAKLSLRNAFLWAIIGWAKGIDCLEALQNRFPAFKDEAQTKSQLINGWCKIRDAVANVLTGAPRALQPGGDRSKRGAKGSAKAPFGFAEAVSEGSASNSTDPLNVVFDENQESKSDRVQTTNPRSPMTVTVEDLLTPLSQNRSFSSSDARVYDRVVKDPIHAEKGLYAIQPPQSTGSSPFSIPETSIAGSFSWTSFGPVVNGHS